MGSPITPEHVATLALASPDRLGRSVLSGASGIVGVGHTAYVLGDELTELASFHDVGAPGALEPVLEPLGDGRGKSRRPDVEALFLLPSGDVAGADALVGWGSGGLPTRDRAFVAPIDVQGRRTGAARTLDLGPLHEHLRRQVPTGLSIEGAAVSGEELLLFHRGALVGSTNLVIHLDLARVCSALHALQALGADTLLRITELQIGDLRGAPLGISDARALDGGRILFAASAERTTDNIDDGEVVGSVVGVLDAQLQVRHLHPLAGPARKVEGIELARLVPGAAAPSTQRAQHGIELALVTDHDDPAVAASVLRVTVGAH